MKMVHIQKFHMMKTVMKQEEKNLTDTTERKLLVKMDNKVTGTNTNKDNNKDNTTTKPTTIVSNGSTAVVLRGIVKVTDLK